MPDEIRQRLEDSTEKCVKAYEEWRKDEKNDAARVSLQEAVHEVRKVASRLEIELVTSKRDNTVHKPMAAPSHRSAKGRHQTADNSGADGNKSTEKAKSFEKLKKKPAPKKEDGGEA